MMWDRRSKLPFRRKNTATMPGFSKARNAETPKSLTPMDLAQLEQKLGGLQHPDVISALELVIANPNDQQLSEILGLDTTSRIEQDIVEHDAFKPTSPGPAQSVSGELTLGVTSEGGAVGLEVNDLLTSMLVTGKSGGGKTNTIRGLALIILQLNRRKR